jgi:hypothetical protein
VARSKWGPVPKTKRWREIAGDAAEDSLLAARAKLAALADVPEVQRAMTFLIALPIASRSKAPAQVMVEEFGIHLEGEPTAGSLSKAIETWIPRAEAGARPAAKRALEEFLNCRPVSDTLFAPDPWQVWRELDGSPFCELGRLFFAFMLERVLIDALEMTQKLSFTAEPDAGSSLIPLPSSIPVTPSPTVTPSPRHPLSAPQHRNTERSGTPQHRLPDIALHALETSRIVQPFVARWYNAQVKGKVPDTGNVRWFLDHSFGKLDLEIERELGGNPIVRSRSAHRQETLDGLEANG